MLENRQQTEDEVINGYVDHIIYRNADNGYTVLVMICDEEEVTCVGTFSDIAEGENIEAHGSYMDQAIELAADEVVDQVGENCTQQLYEQMKRNLNMTE